MGGAGTGARSEAPGKGVVIPLSFCGRGRWKVFAAVLGGRWPPSAAQRPARPPGTQRYARLALARASLAADRRQRAASLGLSPRSPLRGSAGLARRGAAFPPRPLRAGHCAPSAPARQGSSRAAIRRPCLAWGLGGGPARSRVPPFAALALAASRRCARRRSAVRARRVGLGLRVLRPPLLPPGGRKVASAAGPPPLPGAALRPPRRKGEIIHTCCTHAHVCIF